MSPKGLLQKVTCYEKGHTSVSPSEVSVAPASAQQSALLTHPLSREPLKDLNSLRSLAASRDRNTGLLGPPSVRQQTLSCRCLSEKRGAGRELRPQEGEALSQRGSASLCLA